MRWNSHSTAASQFTTWYNDCMPSYFVETPACRYPVLVERGGLANVRQYIPKGAGKVFLISTEDVWQLHGETLARAIGASA